METVKGLHYVDEYLSDKEENNLINFLRDRKEWKIEDKRKSLHYGYIYENGYYSYNNNIPIFLKDLVDKISEKFGKKFDQVIINQNPKGHGVSSHIDNTKLFDETIVMLIINDNCIMKFEKDDKNITVPIKKNSILSLEGDARYKWKHSILSYKKSCFINAIDIGLDKTWISITFRCTKKDI